MKASLSAILLVFFSGGPGGSSLDEAVGELRGCDLSHRSPRCDDAEFLRRLSLDLLGYPPNALQAAAFLADASPDKRAKKIDESLATPRFADFWARRYAEVFFGNYHEPSFDLPSGLKVETRRRLLANFIAWFREQLQDDRPWTEILTEMIAARGNSDAVPQIAYKLSMLSGDRQEINFAAGVSRHFLGIHLHCARCHDHPTEIWRIEDVYGLGAFNTRQVVTRTVEKGVEQAVLQYAEDGEFSLPRRELDPGILPVEGDCYPRFFLKSAPREGDRTRWLADAIVRDGEKRWAKVLANRAWGWLLGRGVVEPLDEFGARNPPASKDLLDRLVATVEAGKGSLKALVRAICLTEAYQRTSASPGRCDKRHYCRGEVLALTGEQLLNSVQVALRGAPGLDLEEAQELTAALTSRPQVGCEVQPLPCGTLHALMFRNSERLWGWIRESPILAEIRKGAPTDGDVIDRLFLSVLTRNPSATERIRFSTFIRDQGNNGLWDACWTLLNTAEFMTRH